jgi:AraC family transcriptional regulator, ethanolamine operon transcriptional activator
MPESRTGTVQTASLRTDDFEVLQEAATDWDQQYFQLSPGKFEGGIELTQVGSRQIFRERWGQKIRYQGTAPQGSFGFALPLDQPGTANWIGRQTCADTVIFQAPGQESDFVSSDYWDALVLGISTQEVQSIVSAF